MVGICCGKLLCLTIRPAYVDHVYAGTGTQPEAKLGITEYTVQIHRGNIMRKMRADSFATLVKLAIKLNFETSEPSYEYRPSYDSRTRGGGFNRYTDPHGLKGNRGRRNSSSSLRASNLFLEE